MPNLEPFLALHGSTVFISGLLIVFAIALTIHIHIHREAQKGARKFITVLMAVICFSTIGIVSHEIWLARNLTKAMYILQNEYVSIENTSGDITLTSGETSLTISGTEIETLKGNPNYAEVIELALLK